MPVETPSFSFPHAAVAGLPVGVRWTRTEDTHRREKGFRARTQGPSCSLPTNALPRIGDDWEVQALGSALEPEKTHLVPYTGVVAMPAMVYATLIDDCCAAVP